MLVIPFEPRTKKNSQQIIKNRANGHYMIIPSKAYKEYEKAASAYLPKLHINYPVNVRCVYYMATKRRVDLVNLEEATLDLLVHAETLMDDNSRVVVSMDGSYVDYDKNNPRTEIWIEDLSNSIESCLNGDGLKTLT